ncbi:hypothetical protein MPC1_1740003 [Methylocella tundrae]|nr:hypothetical protein MPC1_1740003 [Methylocella tundrae]
MNPAAPAMKTSVDLSIERILPFCVFHFGLPDRSQRPRNI